MLPEGLCPPSLSTAVSLQKTALNHLHHEAGAKIVDFAGWEMPILFSSVLDEYKSVRTSSGVFDVSHMGQFFVEGKDSELFLSNLTTWDFSKLSIGKCRYCHILKENGTILDDTIVSRLGSKSFLLVPNASMISKVLNHLNSNRAELDVEIIDRSSEFSCIALQGPNSPSVLESILNLKIKPLSVKSVENIIISGTGYTGEIGYELFVPLNLSNKIWSGALDAGSLPCGLASRDILRLEKGMLLSGQDFDGSQTTLNTGHEWVIDWNHDFIGKSALLAQKTDSYPVMMGILLEDRGIPRRDCEVYYESQMVSRLTSGSLSPSLGKGIALAYLNQELGSEVSILVRNRHLKGKVVKPPFI